MHLPERIRVKLSSEAAGYISMTPVVVRDIPARELLEMMLGMTGKDPDRVHELLLRGTLVNGASRFRWEGFSADRDSIAAVLDTFPDPEPARPFASEFCVRAVLKGAVCRIEIPREVGTGKRLFRKRSYWDVLMEFAARGALRYAGYSYREHADCYLAEVSGGAALALRQNAGAVRYTSLEHQLRRADLDAIEFYVARP
jgi:hypothetical protein